MFFLSFNSWCELEIRAPEQYQPGDCSSSDWQILRTNGFVLTPGQGIQIEGATSPLSYSGMETFQLSIWVEKGYDGVHMQFRWALVYPGYPIASTSCGTKHL